MTHSSRTPIFSFITALASFVSRAFVSKRPFPPVDFTVGETLVRQSNAIRISGLFGYEGRATLTDRRFIYEPTRFHTRPSALDAAFGGARLDIGFRDIKCTRTSSWLQNRCRGLPWLRAIEITDASGKVHKFQVPYSEEWAAEIKERASN